VKEQTGRTRLETFVKYYRSLFDDKTPNIRINPRTGPADRIQAMRILFPQFYFDQTKCPYGINALTQYRREWDEIKQVYKDIPYHDWASHPADALGAFAEGYVEVKKVSKTKSFEQPKKQGWRSEVGMR